MSFGQTPIGVLAQKVANLNDTKIWLLSANTPIIKKLITDLNTEDQLFDDNIDSTGVKLSAIGGGYSNITLVASKTPKKGKFDINLRDTGEFYRSWKVTVDKTGILIQADTDKDGTDLQERWGDNIIGLTDENLGVVTEAIKENYIRVLRREIGI
jgi:hypothetical protein